MRVKLPRNPDELTSLGEKIVKRSRQDAEKSPLHQLVATDIEEKIRQAEQLSLEAAEHRRQSERLVELRNLLLADVNQFIRSSRDILLATHPDMPRKLSEYGFDVVTSPASRRTDGEEKPGLEQPE